MNMSEANANELMTGAEAAEFLRISPKTLPRWRWEGSGPNFVRVGRKVFYRRGDLAEYLLGRVVRVEGEN